MEIRQMQYFIELVHQGSYVKAAKALFITQPTLTWTIKKMEREVGSPLVVYENRQLTLTAVGDIVYQKANEILETQQLMLDEIHELSNALYKPLRIGLKLVVAEKLFPLIQEFQKEYPQQNIEIYQEGTLKAYEMILNNELDIAFISNPYPLKGLGYRDIHGLEFKLSVFINKKHFTGTKTSLSFKDLEFTPFSLLSKDYILNPWIKKRCKENGFIPNIQIENSNWELLSQQLGSSVLILPSFYSRFMNEEILELSLDDEENTFPVKLVTLKNTVLTLPMKRFIDFATKYI